MGLVSFDVVPKDRGPRLLAIYSCACRYACYETRGVSVYINFLLDELRLAERLTRHAATADSIQMSLTYEQLSG